jgi:hypothetical protein
MRVAIVQEWVAGCEDTFSHDKDRGSGAGNIIHKGFQQRRCGRFGHNFPTVGRRRNANVTNIAVQNVVLKQ